MRSLQNIFNASFMFIAVLLIFGITELKAQTADAQRWVGTWSAAPYEAGTNTPPSPYLANNTLRQVVRVSIGGDTLRVKFSNRTSSTPVTMNSVNIAVSTDRSTSVIDISTMKQLKFDGNESVTMNAYSEVTSDPIAFPLTPGMNLAITIYYGEIKTASDMTFHYGSRTDSYILTGDQTASADFSGATTVERWYNISSIDVLASDESGAVAVLGNSITDGYGIHNGQDKWTDTFSEKLLADSSTSHVSVLNLGIGATLVTTSGLSRFQKDILAQPGLRWIIIFYGVNDIAANISANNIIDAFKNMIYQAHAQNIRIYGATITPFEGHSYYSTAHETVRDEVNKWIRTPGNFDKCIDFDKAIRDPADTLKLRADYSNDWLHPNTAGYKLLGESVDLSLFQGADTVFAQPEGIESLYYEAECATVGANWEILDDAQASNGKYVTVKPGVQSLNAAPAGSESYILIPFSVDTAGSYSVFARLNCPTFDDDSYWVKMDDGEFQLNNGLVTSGWEWKKFNDYTLAEGEHTLTIAYREDGADLDKIAVSNSVFAPDGMGEEAENICTPTDAENSTEVPDNYALEQNYPNPFNPVTTIKYSIPFIGTRQAVSVQLKVYDMLGREIVTLVDGVKAPGNYEVKFDANHGGHGRSMVSGVYLYRIKAGSFTETKKFMLLK